jgi:hypothetical protein
MRMYQGARSIGSCRLISVSHAGASIELITAPPVGFTGFAGSALACSHGLHRRHYGAIRRVPA